MEKQEIKKMMELKKKIVAILVDAEKMQKKVELVLEIIDAMEINS